MKIKKNQTVNIYFPTMLKFFTYVCSSIDNTIALSSELYPSLSGPKTMPIAKRKY